MNYKTFKLIFAQFLEQTLKCVRTLQYTVVNMNVREDTFNPYYAKKDKYNLVNFVKEGYWYI